MKHIISIASGIVGGIVAALFGGWQWVLTALMILMCLDYVSGLVVAGVFHNSPKSPNGGLESHAGLKGLIRKIFILALVAVAHIADRLLGTTFFRDAAAIAFCANEIISILENAGLMGIKIPKVFRKAIDVLRSKAKETEEQEEKPPDKEDSSQIAGATEDTGASWTPPPTEYGTRGVIILQEEDPEDLSGLELEEVFGVDQGEDA